MRVAAITAPHEIEIRELPTPEVGPHQVLVRVNACALCTFEQRVYQGIQHAKLPFVGGHEYAGVVAAVGAGVAQTLAPGDQIVIGPDHCGECEFCRRGETARCPFAFGRQYYPGLYGPMGLADHRLVDSRLVYKLPRPTPIEEAVLVEPLSCAVHALRRARVGLGDDVVIIGAGPMGMLNLLVALRCGARVFVSDLNPARLGKAAELGAQVVLDPRKDDPVSVVRAETDGRGADVVIAAVGSGAVNEQAVALLGPLGRLVLFASAHPSTPLAVDPNLVHGREWAIVGSVSKNLGDFSAAIKLISHRVIDVRPLIDELVPLAEIRRAFERSIDPETYRVVVTM